MAHSIFHAAAVNEVDGSCMSDTDPKESDTYSEAETVARREAALRRLLATPPKPHKKAVGAKRKRQADGPPEEKIVKESD